MSNLRQVISPTLSTFLMITGVTLMAVALPIYLENLGYSKIMIGIIAASYCAGMAYGSFKIEPIVSAVGHIRSFCAFIAIMVVSVLIPVIFDNFFTWFIFRFFCGLALGGLYVVLESWFLSIGNKKNSGLYLSIYMAALGLGSSLAPFFMNIKSAGVYTIFIITAIFLSASSATLSLKRGPAPEIGEHSVMTISNLFKISKIGVIGCIISGFMISSMQSLLPLILTQQQFSTAEISITLAALIFGNFCFQYPVGYISDKYDRRNVLQAICLIGMIAYLCAILFYTQFSIFYLLCIFIIGGSIFSLYPIAISFTCDQIEQKDIMKAIQGLLLVYGIGSVFGPLVISFALKFFGSVSLFLINSFFLGLLMFYILRSKILGKKNIEPVHTHNIMPTATSTIPELNDTKEVL
jgi:MFS family permease